jgi:hypothetical protein
LPARHGSRSVTAMANATTNFQHIEEEEEEEEEAAAVAA